jgi:putative ABC transport system permease protein
VKRRRLQTLVIGLVVLCSTTTILLGLGLLTAASAPFDKAFDQQRGAHAVAAFDLEKASRAQLVQTAHRPGVEAAAGPFGQAVLEMPEDWLWMSAGSLAVVGRADPDGPVDRIRLLEGRWATAPGEIVVNWPVDGTPGPGRLGSKLKASGAPTLTVVGFATSMSKSAGAWVSPEQMDRLNPTTAQMLYRFPNAATDQGLRTDLTTATAGLPSGSLTTAQSYLTLKRAFSAQADAYLPFMTLFGVLGLLVSVLIVGNVVSGAVVSGHRHIGVLKSLGFTPNQVVAVYLTMVSIPAIIGCAVGTLIGNAVAGPILKVAFSGIETGSASIGIGWWPSVVCLVGMPHPRRHCRPDPRRTRSPAFRGPGDHSGERTADRTGTAHPAPTQWDPAAACCEPGAGPAVHPTGPLPADHGGHRPRGHHRDPDDRSDQHHGRLRKSRQGRWFRPGRCTGRCACA